MKSVIIKTAVIFLICIAFAQTSSAMGWRGGYYRHSHCDRGRGYYYAPAPQVFIQPYYFVPQVHYCHPHYHGGYGYRGGYRR